MALYCLDWDSGGRAQEIEVLDAASGVVLDRHSLSNFTQGRYLLWDVTEKVKLRLRRTAGYNAVLSGLFFDTVP